MVFRFTDMEETEAHLAMKLHAKMTKKEATEQNDVELGP